MKIEDKMKSDVKKLEKIREAHGWTQKKMASEVGVTLQTYHDWKQDRKRPSIESWEKIKDYLEG